MLLPSLRKWHLVIAQQIKTIFRGMETITLGLINAQIKKHFLPRNILNFTYENENETFKCAIVEHVQSYFMVDWHYLNVYLSEKMSCI